eukprot:92855-Alexandrium_andersonii.AAC.1
MKPLVPLIYAAGATPRILADDLLCTTYGSDAAKDSANGNTTALAYFERLGVWVQRKKCISLASSK